ncbi:hypothetical protein KCP69_26270 [Salmonella enterica subsp. enterica]|nr:hypothetical protein KCP69_26270 [Salmonella enterica subsp. enterica]
MMKAETPPFGISFCGSGGAGANTAQTSMATKPNMECGQDEGVTAITKLLQRSWVSALWIKKSRRKMPVQRGKRNTAPDDERAIHHHGEKVKVRRRQSTRSCRCAEPCSGSAVMRESPYILLRIEPQDVRDFNSGA